jgi:hypothetical protein
VGRHPSRQYLVSPEFQRHEERFRPRDVNHTSPAFPIPPMPHSRVRLSCVIASAHVPPWRGGIAFLDHSAGSLTLSNFVTTESVGPKRKH